MNTNDTVKHVILYISITLIIITVTFSASRAYYLARITVADKINDTTITNANLDIEFLTSQYINEAKMMLINDSERQASAPYTSFAITSKSTSTISATYTLYLTDFTISDNFVSNDFKWELARKTDNGEEQVAIGNFANAITGKDYTLTSTGITIAPQDTHQYIFRVWLSYTDKDQASLLDGSFSGKVALTTGKITNKGN